MVLLYILATGNVANSSSEEDCPDSYAINFVDTCMDESPDVDPHLQKLLESILNKVM